MNGLTTLLPSRLTQLWRSTGLARPAVLQIAAICYRHVGDGHEILLITSRGRGRWLLPKGWPKPRKSFAQMAAIEAFEEAGVRGEVGAQPIGRFKYSKSIAGVVMLDFEAEVYPIQVSDVSDEFPESGERKVGWFSPQDAAQVVDFPQLKKLLLEFQP